MEDAICPAGCSVNQWFAFLTSLWRFPVSKNYSAKHNQWCYPGLDLAIDRAFPCWTSVSMYLPHNSKNSTLKNTDPLGKGSPSEVQEVLSCCGWFSVLDPNRHIKRFKSDFLNVLDILTANYIPLFDFLTLCRLQYDLMCLLPKTTAINSMQ